MMLMESQYYFSRFSQNTKNMLWRQTEKYIKSFHSNCMSLLALAYTGNFHMILHYCHEIDIGLKFCG